MQPLRLGLAGLGTVGGGVVEALDAHGAEIAARTGRGLEIVAVSARSRTRNRGIDVSRFRWVDDPVAMARESGIDVVVELIGGESGAAKATVEAAIGAGKPVVTANKALLAKHGLALAEAAETAGVALGFEAAVAGGIPIIKTLREAMAGNRVTRVAGILNGTCNYILTRMTQEGLPFGQVLADAQAKGYAEADPTFDIGGFDTAHKLSLLTSLAFGTRLAADEVYIEGIEAIDAADIAAADELGYRIKLLGVASLAESGGIEQRVHPALIPKHTAIAEVDGVLNCVALEGDFVGELMLVGRGAGARATASAVIADLADIARGGPPAPVFGRPFASLAPYTAAAITGHRGGYYVSLKVVDRPGSFAAVAQRFAAQGISLESIVQRRKGGETGTLSVTIITHDTGEAAMRAAVSAIAADGHVSGVPRTIRIERL